MKELYESPKIVALNIVGDNGIESSSEHDNGYIGSDDLE